MHLDSSVVLSVFLLDSESAVDYTFYRYIETRVEWIDRSIGEDEPRTTIENFRSRRSRKPRKEAGGARCLLGGARCLPWWRPLQTKKATTFGSEKAAAAA